MDLETASGTVGGGSRGSAQRPTGKGVLAPGVCSLGWPLRVEEQLQAGQLPCLIHLSGGRDGGQTVPEAKAYLSSRAVASEHPLGGTPLFPLPCSAGSHPDTLSPNIQPSPGQITRCGEEGVQSSLAHGKKTGKGREFSEKKEQVALSP